MVSFVPFNITKESSITSLLYQIDNAVQYSEGLEPKDPANEQEEEEEHVDD